MSEFGSFDIDLKLTFADVERYYRSYVYGSVSELKSWSTSYAIDLNSNDDLKAQLTNRIEYHLNKYEIENPASTTIDNDNGVRVHDVQTDKWVVKDLFFSYEMDRKINLYISISNEQRNYKYTITTYNKDGTIKRVYKNEIWNLAARRLTKKMYLIKPCCNKEPGEGKTLLHYFASDIKYKEGEVFKAPFWTDDEMIENERRRREAERREWMEERARNHALEEQAQQRPIVRTVEIEEDTVKSNREKYSVPKKILGAIVTAKNKIKDSTIYTKKARETYNQAIKSGNISANVSIGKFYGELYPNLYSINATYTRAGQRRLKKELTKRKI